MEKLNKRTINMLRRLNIYQIADLAELMKSFHTGKRPHPQTVKNWIRDNDRNLTTRHNVMAIKAEFNIEGNILDELPPIDLKPRNV